MVTQVTVNFWAHAREIPWINQVAIALCKLVVDLEKEDNAVGFLGETLDCKAPTVLLEMKQTGLIKRVIEALGLDDGYAKGKYTPPEAQLLVKDADGEEAHSRFSYSSVIGMPLYLSGHTCPNIAYAMNCCTTYKFCSKHSHKLALKCIGQYLKQMPDHGMVMNPSTELCKIDAISMLTLQECTGMMSLLFAINAMALNIIDWGQISLNMTSSRRYCPDNAIDDLFSVIRKGTTPFAAQSWMLLSIPLGVGFPG